MLDIEAKIGIIEKENNELLKKVSSLSDEITSGKRAKQQVQPQTDKEKNIDTSYQGIYKHFVEIMRSLQVAAVSVVGSCCANGWKAF
ncbi:hypothetical protein NC653_014117 [Populus alba x Populus x berolinensis]|uniref:Uncharacterized protein n=1 Tax=Populus alba x Populus x berolinensis TaxID=444605 RepID=A0AAD6QW51_9ROSI|nr:hypothetical protein NC653_014117 [Populus alba x Populus x berolinensis]